MGCLKPLAWFVDELGVLSVGGFSGGFEIDEGWDWSAVGSCECGLESTMARRWAVSSVAAFRRVVGSFEVRGL